MPGCLSGQKLALLSKPEVLARQPVGIHFAWLLVWRTQRNQITTFVLNIRARRMKTAMLSGQEADDEKLSWRVDAEVRLKLEELRHSETAHSSALQVNSTFSIVQSRWFNSRNCDIFGPCRAVLTLPASASTLLLVCSICD